MVETNTHWQLVWLGSWGYGHSSLSLVIQGPVSPYIRRRHVYQKSTFPPCGPGRDSLSLGLKRCIHSLYIIEWKRYWLETLIRITIYIWILFPVIWCSRWLWGGGFVGWWWRCRLCFFSSVKAKSSTFPPLNSFGLHGDQRGLMHGTLCEVSIMITWKW